MVKLDNNKERTVNINDKQCGNNVIAFDPLDNDTQKCVEKAHNLTARWVTIYLIQMIRAYASHHNNRDLIKQVNLLRNQRWMMSWVHKKLPILTCLGVESAAEELFGPLQELIILWDVLDNENFPISVESK